MSKDNSELIILKSINLCCEPNLSYILVSFVRYVRFSQMCHKCSESKKGCSCILYVIFIMQLLLNIMSSNLPGYLVFFIVYAFSKIHALKTLIFFSTLFFGLQSFT